MAGSFCTNCGSRLVPGSRFCQQCGFALQTDSTEAVRAKRAEMATALSAMALKATYAMRALQAKLAVAEPPSGAGRARFCTSCGTPRPTADRFCQQCGGAFES